MSDTKALLDGVRRKYPGAYDNVPDEQLLAGVKKKFPGAYDNYSITPVQAQNPQESLSSPKNVALSAVIPGGPVTIGAAKGIGDAYNWAREGASDLVSKIIPEGGPKIFPPGPGEAVGKLFKMGVLGKFDEKPEYKANTARETGKELAGFGFDAASGYGTSKVPTLLSKIGKPFAGLARNIKNVGTASGRAGLVSRTRGAITETKRASGEAFEQTLNTLTEQNPDRLVDLSGAINQLKNDLALEPKLMTAVNRSPRLQALLEQDTQQVTLKEAQAIKNELSSRLSKSKLAGQGVRSDDISLFDTIDDIREAQLSAFPDESFGEFAEARRQYGETARAYDTVRGKIKPGSLEKNIYSKFGGDIEVENALKKLLPKENMSEVTGARRTKLAGKAAGATALAGLGTTGIGLIIRKLFGRLE